MCVAGKRLGVVGWFVGGESSGILCVDFPLSRSPGFRREEVGDKHFLLAVESPEVWEISFGVLFECSNGRAIFPRIRYGDVDPVGSGDDESL